MTHQPYIIAIMLFATINGIFSPLVLALVPFVLALTPAFFLNSIAVIFFISSLLLATMTLILGGVPAALYERWSGSKESTGFSMWLWLVGTGMLTLPAASNFFKFGL